MAEQTAYVLGGEDAEIARLDGQAAAIAGATDADQAKRLLEVAERRRAAAGVEIVRPGGTMVLVEFDLVVGAWGTRR